MTIKTPIFTSLIQQFSGDFYTDDLHTTIYATDASAYRMIPMAVALPKTKADITLLIDFAQKHSISLIPRAAGTSLAGQCVGDGIIVDMSKYFNKIITLDKASKTVKVQPGVIRDELNTYLKPYNLFFGPNTSTSNRCMIGGMVGNNSSGTTSIQYGVTRDKVLALKTILSDGTDAVFKSLSKDEFNTKKRGNNLESSIYRNIYNLLSPKEIQEEIHNQFPKTSIHRRNTGYAIDNLVETEIFSNSNEPINLAKLLCGSEGTLAFSTEITLKLDALPPRENVMVAVHFNSINESLKAVLVAMKHNLHMCELMDKTILDCTKNNREHIKNRFFIKGDPEAILMIELRADTLEETKSYANKLITDLQDHNFGYAYPMLFEEEINKAVSLRKAGLGLLGNIVGDKKAVPCIEDTAVEVQDLPNYIEEFTAIMKTFNQKAVYYAHAGAGELHLRPILNLKKGEDVQLFKKITYETALLVKKYKGSFSGEHGDGIVRAEFIPLMIGDKNYELLKKIKSVFDPNNIFNRGKIVDPFPINKSLRYETDSTEPKIETVLDFSDSLGILRAAEKCNGSADCRKLPSAGGTMCPSYRATRNEKDTTRARANALREFLTTSEKDNKFNHKELYDVFDLCLSCKACSSECPSNVDVSALKAEFLHQYYQANGIPFKTKLFASNSSLNKIGSYAPAFTNLVTNTKLFKKLLGIAYQRSMPKLAKTTFIKWLKYNNQTNSNHIGELYLFIDEFTNYYDVEIGIDTVTLLTKLGYKIKTMQHQESGRSYISKGLLKKAKAIANHNIAIFKNFVTDQIPLVGIEPSAILSFRDEYLRLADDKESANKIAKHTFTIEEFIKREFDYGKIHSKHFTNKKRNLKIHGHCHQKALSNIESTFSMLSIPSNYTPVIINSGCCGMAGSFGYEQEHYNISMTIGEDTLFPKIRNIDSETLIVASGTSCRHQIKDGTNRDSKHPVTILKEALI